MSTEITAGQAHPGDVVQTADGTVYQAPDADGTQGWSAMQPIGFFGDPAATAPAGPLTLLRRDGQPAGSGYGDPEP